MWFKITLLTLKEPEQGVASGSFFSCLFGGTGVLIDSISAVKACQAALVVALILGFPKIRYFSYGFQLLRVAIFAFRP